MTTTQTLEEPIQQANCATCPYFQDFGEPNGRGWCKMFDQMARSNHLRTGACDQEIKAIEVAQQPAPQPLPQQIQPTGFSFDSTGCELQDPNESPQQLEPEAQATPQLKTEFEQGRIHGRNDALAGWHPIYSGPATEYATGYLTGYNTVLNPTVIQPDDTQPASWSVCLDRRWGVYQAWVNDRCIATTSSYEEAEKKAQSYVATDRMIKRQNEAVMKAYALGA